MRISDLIREQKETSSGSDAAHDKERKSIMRISDLVREQKETSPVPGAEHVKREYNIGHLVRFKGEPPAAEESAVNEEIPETKQEEAAAGQTDTEVQPAPKTQESDLPAGPEPSLPVSAQTASGKELYAEARDYLTDFRQNLLSSGKGIGPERSLGLIDRITESVSVIEEMYPITLLFGHDDLVFIDHAINNMIYSLKLGIRMGYPLRRLVGLGLAALHHDIGMFLIPEQILAKTQRLTAAELAEIQKHPGTGRNLLKTYDAIDPEISRAVYEHHERESKQGYPEGIGNGMICEYAKIIGICDSYEAMTHNRPHKKAMEQYVSVLELAGTKDLLFDPRIVKVFLDVITVYPIGSYVRLNNNAIGVVVATNTGNPFRPVVGIVRDGQGYRLSGEQKYDLMQTSILNIVTGVKAEEASA
jgi:HD-GYP domain-containing protein (c-di-GMP phosphodiesterase class II)